MTGNERWRVITPILLFVLTLMSGWATKVLADLNDKVKVNCELIQQHMVDPRLHYSVVKDIEWIKKFLISNGGIR